VNIYRNPIDTFLFFINPRKKLYRFVILRRSLDYDLTPNITQCVLLTLLVITNEHFSSWRLLKRDHNVTWFD